jgi:hypothetical protein
LPSFETLLALSLIAFIAKMWRCISIIVVLLGAELDAKGERQVSNKTRPDGESLSPFNPN